MASLGRGEQVEHAVTGIGLEPLQNLKHRTLALERTQIDDESVKRLSAA